MRRLLALIVFAGALLAGTSVASADSGGYVIIPGNAEKASNPAPHTIVVDTERSPQQITVFRWDKLRNAYVVRARFKVATGLPEFPTPKGSFTIQVKVKNPTWVAPHSKWVPKSERGKKFGPDDPGNPLVGAWLGLSGDYGIGFHGTREESTLGGQASHGCLRMSKAGVESLYRIVEVDTPVTIR